MRYGFPYNGSKAAFADKLLDNFPKDKAMIDLFAGGGAVSHAWIKRGGRVISNDIFTAVPLKNFFSKDKSKYIRYLSREDFKRENDFLMKSCYSFGNTGKSYIYNPEVEKRFEGFTKDILFGGNLSGLGITGNTIEERKVMFADIVREALNDENHPLHEKIVELKGEYSYDFLHTPRTVTNILRVIQDTGGAPETIFALNYKEFPFGNYDPSDWFIYCDPPYKNTMGYMTEFDSDSFFEWCREMKKKGWTVYVSEFDAPFERIWYHYRPVQAGNNRVANGKRRQTYHEDGLYLV